MRAAASVLLLWSAAAYAQQVTVPFVGCPADGQLGPQEAPTGEPEPVDLDTKDAGRLAYYFGYRGVLAPRGWQCFGNVGSSGTLLVVAPRVLDSQTIFQRRGFSGPFVMVGFTWGGSSGRQDVAEVITRASLERNEFVERIAEMFPFPDDFPKGPHATDRLTKRNNSLVEYRTPPQTEGLGTPWWIKPDNRPIEGVVMILGEPRTMNLVLLGIRLPEELESLAPAIIRQMETDALLWE